MLFRTRKSKMTIDSNTDVSIELRLPAPLYTSKAADELLAKVLGAIESKRHEITTELGTRLLGKDEMSAADIEYGQLHVRWTRMTIETNHAIDHTALGLMFHTIMGEHIVPLFITTTDDIPRERGLELVGVGTTAGGRRADDLIG